jgi:hypothetical protein
LCKFRGSIRGSIILGSADAKFLFLVIAGAGTLRQANQRCLRAALAVSR